MEHTADKKAIFKALLGSAALLLMVLSMVACSDTAAPTPEDADMTLNLDTLEAETEVGTAQAERAANSYVDSIGGGRAIGIALLDDAGTGEEQNHQQRIVAYLYDGDDLAQMVGEVGAEGTATLESGDLGDFDATVEVVIEDDTVSGTATFPGERPAPFTADAATGISGVYWADGTDEDPEASCHWVVLSDGRQWGCVCVPPFTRACCELKNL